MNEYKILVKTDIKQIKNWFFDLIRSPKRLIMFLLYFVFMGWIVFANLKNFNNGSIMKSIENFDVYFNVSILALTLYLGFVTTKANAVTFKLSEVNLLFTSPVDSRKILMYSMIKKIPMHLLISLFISTMMLSMFYNSVSSNSIDLIVAIGGYLLLGLALEPIGFLLFIIKSKLNKHNFVEKFMQILGLIIGVLLLIAILVEVNLNGFSFISILKGLSNTYLEWIPLVGWGKHLIAVALVGLTTKSYIMMALLLLSYIVSLVIMYIWGNDYYEDVIAGSEKRNDTMNDYKAGKQKFAFKLNLRKGKKAIAKRGKPFAYAFDWKRRTLIRRSDLSEYFSFETAIVFVITILGYFLMAGEEDAFLGVYFIVGLLFYIKFLFSGKTHLDEELRYHFYFTVPDSAIKKVIAVIKVDVIRFSINVSIIIVLYSILQKQILFEYILLMPLAISFYVMTLLSSYLFNLFLPQGDFERLSILFKMIQNILILFPAIMVIIIIGFITKSVILAMAGGVIFNLLFCGVFLAFSEFLFSKLELK